MLNELLRELRHRASPTAQALQRRVEGALRRLPPEAPPVRATPEPAAAARPGEETPSAPRPSPSSPRASASASASPTGPAASRPSPGARAAEPMPASLRIRCRTCQTELRVQVRAPCAVYGCPRCGGEFEAAWRDRAFQIEWRPVEPPQAASQQAGPRQAGPRQAGPRQAASGDGGPKPAPPVDDETPMTEALARQILAVGPRDGAPAIKRAWRRASQHYHPDKHGRLPERLQQAAEREIKRINAAYDFLMRAHASVPG